jgi:hypothetical protein
VDFCAEHFPRAALMAGGQILADGPASEVFASAEALRRADVEPPQLMRLAAALNLGRAPLGVEQFVDALAHRP